jgi:hypothetical protein
MTRTATRTQTALSFAIASPDYLRGYAKAKARAAGVGKPQTRKAKCAINEPFGLLWSVNGAYQTRPPKPPYARR